MKLSERQRLAEQKAILARTGGRMPMPTAKDSKAAAKDSQHGGVATDRPATPSGLHRNMSGLHPAAGGTHGPTSGLQTAGSGLQSAMSGLQPALSGAHSAVGGLHPQARGLQRQGSGGPAEAPHTPGKTLHKIASGLHSQGLLGPSEAPHVMGPVPSNPLTRRKSAMGPSSVHPASSAVSQLLGQLSGAGKRVSIASSPKEPSEPDHAPAAASSPRQSMHPSRASDAMVSPRRPPYPNPAIRSSALFPTSSTARIAAAPDPDLAIAWQEASPSFLVGSPSQVEPPGPDRIEPSSSPYLPRLTGDDPAPGQISPSGDDGGMPHATRKSAVQASSSLNMERLLQDDSPGGVDAVRGSEAAPLHPTPSLTIAHLLRYELGDFEPTTATSAQPIDSGQEALDTDVSSRQAAAQGVPPQHNSSRAHTPDQAALQPSSSLSIAQLLRDDGDGSEGAAALADSGAAVHEPQTSIDDWLLGDSHVLEKKGSGSLSTGESGAAADRRPVAEVGCMTCANVNMCRATCALAARM